MLNLCCSTTKKNLSVQLFFGKYFFFYKKCQNFKNSIALFQRISHGLIQSHAPVASPHKNFLLLTSRSMSQSQKILKIFFKIWVFNVYHRSVWQLVRRWRFQSQGYLEIFVAYLTTLSWVELPVAKNTQKYFSKFLS